MHLVANCPRNYTSWNKTLAVNGVCVKCASTSLGLRKKSLFMQLSLAKDC